MTFTLKDIKHLDVMANLTNATPVPTQEINIKALLATDTVREVTVDEKIMSLCSKLRQEGFNKQADGLEEKFLTYKSATTHLYRVHDEDGEDLVDAAHPDGENAICDAGGDLGTVETIVTEHKKLVDIITKEPKGKHASRSVSLYKLSAEMEDPQIALSVVGKKFKYMADYIQTHALTDVPEGNSLKPEQRNFYAAAALWHAMADLIARELSSEDLVATSHAVELVRNRIQNNQATVIKQHANQINSLADMDQLISAVLSRIIDKNPNKFAGKLSTYVKECEAVLKTAQIGMLAGPIGYGAELIHRSIDPIKMLGDLAQRVEALQSKLQDLSEDKDAVKFPKLMGKLHVVAPLLAKALDIEITVQSLLANPKNKTTALRTATSFYTSLQETVNDLDLEVKNTYRRVENSIGSQIYHLVYLSNFKWVTSAIKSLNVALSGVLNQLAIAISSAPPTGPVSSTNFDTSFDLTKEDSDASAKPAEVTMIPQAVEAVKRLRDFLPQIPTLNISDAKKSEVTGWVTSQIQEFQTHGNDPAKVNEMIKDMVEFNRQLTILQGKK